MLPIGRNFRHLFAFNSNIRVRFDFLSRLAKTLAVNRQRAAGRHLMRVALAIIRLWLSRNSACSRPTALVSASSERKELEHTNSASPSVTWASVLRTGAFHAAPLEHRLSRLPRRFGTGQTAANNVKHITHELQIHALTEEWKPAHQICDAAFLSTSRVSILRGRDWFLTPVKKQSH